MDRPADPGFLPRVPSGHVLSETAGARKGLQALQRLNRPEDDGAIRRLEGGLHRRGNRNFRGRRRARPASVLRIWFAPLQPPRRYAVTGTGSTAPLASSKRHVATGGIFPPVERATVDRAEKKEAVAALREVFSKTSVVVVAHYCRPDGRRLQKLRSQMTQAGATVKVAKNRLAKIALEGTDVASIGPLLKGPTLLAYSERSGGGAEGRRRLRQGPTTSSSSSAARWVRPL